MYLIRQMQTISEATDQKQVFGPNHFSLDDSHCGSGDGGDGGGANRILVWQFCLHEFIHSVAQAFSSMYAFCIKNI